MFETGFRHRLVLFEILCFVVVSPVAVRDDSSVIEDLYWLFFVDISSLGGVECCSCWFVDSDCFFLSSDSFCDAAFEDSVGQGSELFVDYVSLLDQKSPSANCRVSSSISRSRSSAFSNRSSMSISLLSISSSSRPRISPILWWVSTTTSSGFESLFSLLSSMFCRSIVYHLLVFFRCRRTRWSRLVLGRSGRQPASPLCLGGR